MTLTSDLERLHAFVFPGGEDAARRIRGLHDIQKGELRAAPGATWTSFTAEETILATSSNFHWSARAGLFTVADAYDETGGHLVIKAGLFPVKKLTGPDMDKGQLQRCLGLIACCPAILLNHPTLASEPLSPGTVRFHDTTVPTGAYIDFDVDSEGCPVRCHAIRPRVESKEMIPTLWSVVASEFREWQGLRLACKYEVAWQLPEGPFPYLRAELTTLTAIT